MSTHKAAQIQALQIRASWVTRQTDPLALLYRGHHNAYESASSPQNVHDLLASWTVNTTNPLQGPV
jgi:hypothetical protein